MIFTETNLIGAYIIDIDKKEDERGFFARSFCQDEFRENNLKANFVQCNISYNKKKGTLRGMHYQIVPHQEVKLVRCIRGCIYDVIIDLRRNSQTFGKWFAVELSAENHKMLYVPEGFAHGYQTLCDDSEVFYHVSEFYHPESENGIRWDDKAFKVKWPLNERTISVKDSNWSDFDGT